MKCSDNNKTIIFLYNTLSNEDIKNLPKILQFDIWNNKLNVKLKIMASCFYLLSKWYTNKFRLSSGLYLLS